MIRRRLMRLERSCAPLLNSINRFTKAGAELKPLLSIKPAAANTTASKATLEDGASRVVPLMRTLLASRDHRLVKKSSHKVHEEHQDHQGSFLICEV
jgi:hypothetical protein